MANEAERIDNPTSTPVIVSTSYQQQNVVANAARIGVDTSIVEHSSGLNVVIKISGPIDVNGVLYEVKTDTILTISADTRYWIYLAGSGSLLTPTLTTTQPTFDQDKNGLYTQGEFIRRDKSYEVNLTKLLAVCEE